MLTVCAIACTLQIVLSSNVSGPTELFAELACYYFHTRLVNQHSSSAEDSYFHTYASTDKL